MAHQPTSEPLLREAIKNTDVAASEVAHQPTSEPFALSGTWLGQSFGRAGSAALEMNVPKAAGPHNMYLEVYIVGGLVFLGSLISVQLLALRVMLGRALSGHFMYQMSLALFSLICLYMTGYPNIYEPITGSLFWLIIGIAARAQPSNRFAA